MFDMRMGTELSSNGLETPQNLPTLIQAENQDTVMPNSNPCLTEPTKQTEASTTPIPKAAPVGARLDSALARQTRARKAVEAADKMLTIAKQRMKETMEELEQANSAVEIAKKKVGPATGLASDVAMLLELLKPHMNSLSMNAADIIARIEGDVKVVRIRETRFKECASGERPPGIQLTQLDMLGMEAQEMASQLQAMEAMSGRGRGGESKEGKNRCWAEPKKCSLTESLNNAANSIKDQKPETPMKTASSSSSSAHDSKETPKAVEKPNNKEAIEEECNGVTETLMRAVGTDWSELDETVKTNVAKAVQDRFKP